MRELIEKAREELTRRVLAGEYSNLRIEEYKGDNGYLCDVYFSIDGYDFHYGISAGSHICDHSSITLIGLFNQEVIDHFTSIFNGTSNSKGVEPSIYK